MQEIVFFSITLIHTALFISRLNLNIRYNLVATITDVSIYLILYYVNYTFFYWSYFSEVYIFIRIILSFVIWKKEY